MLEKREQHTEEAISKETTTNSMAYYIAIYSVIFYFSKYESLNCLHIKNANGKKIFFEINIIRVKIVYMIYILCEAFVINIIYIEASSVYTNVCKKLK